MYINNLAFNVRVETIIIAEDITFHLVNNYISDLMIDTRSTT